jgi:hypothetical protein
MKSATFLWPMWARSFCFKLSPIRNRIVADCPPEKDAILDLAARFGLLTVSLSRSPAPGKAGSLSSLPTEPVEVWKTTIRELRSTADIWDRIASGDLRGRELLEKKLAANLARVPFHLTAVDGDGGPFRLRYRPPDLRAGIWQRLAGEAAGLIRCTRCPAPSCGRWFLKGGASRSDRQFCADRCRVRAFRWNANAPQRIRFSALRT